MKRILLATLGILACFLMVMPGSAQASCGSCLNGIRECASAAKKEFAKCRKECRSTADGWAEKLDCFASCLGVRQGELEMCTFDGDSCAEECMGIVDGACLQGCASEFQACAGDARSEFRECLKGSPGCRQAYRRDRGVCTDLGDLDARRACKRYMRGAYGGCLHECGKEIAGDVHGCFINLRECIADCAPLCGSTHPECGGLCPGASECTPVEDGCQCIPTGITPCGDSHPECDGACPPGLECGSIDEGLACGCVPDGNIPCGEGSTPECDGACPAGLSCREAFGHCLCVPGEGIACGEMHGPPQCAGLCPLETPICTEREGACTCVEIPDPPLCGEIPGFGECGGLCPPETPLCRDVGGVCTCTPLPEPPPCEEANFPFCGGVCPDGEICLLDFESQGCRCRTEQSLGCGELLGPPLCAGLCPLETPICREVEDTCACTAIPEPPVCGEVMGPPECGGLCPPEAPICKEVEGACACTALPDPPACGEAHFPLCGGSCPEGELCLPDLDSEQCQCKSELSLECGELVGPPMCAGFCPPETPFCKEVDGVCACMTLPDPPTCGQANFPLCGGACPDGDLCLPDLPSGQCQCRSELSLECGELVGPPMCLGICPPEAPVCQHVEGQCVCGGS